MASTCRLFAFCFLALSAVSALAGTQSVRSSSGIIVASAQVSRPIGLTEIPAQIDRTDSAPDVPQATLSVWYLHAIRPETILFELSSGSSHLLLQSSRLVSLNRELTAIAEEESIKNVRANVTISITTIAD